MKVESFKGDGTPQKYYELNRKGGSFQADEKQVRAIINALDKEDRWLAKHVSISNPYTGDGQKQGLTDEFASTNAGDETDTSPFRDESDQLYISLEYIKNMNILINYLKEVKKSIK